MVCACVRPETRTSCDVGVDQRTACLGACHRRFASSGGEQGAARSEQGAVEVAVERTECHAAMITASCVDTPQATS